VLGPGHYSTFLPIIKNKLLKITKITDNINEFKYLSEIYKIKKYQKYYCIPDKEIYTLDKTNKFYEYVQNLVNKDEITIFNNSLKCYYVNYAGDKELFDTICDLNNNYNFWDSYKKIYRFTKKIMKGINYLHEKKICHLDIKPENIIVNTYKNTFKIIDFGFSSIEPFDDFVFNIKGTPEYFPADFKRNTYKFLPKIYANDVKLVNNQIPLIANRKLVYKIDSYCLGRVLYLLKNTYKINNPDNFLTRICFNKYQKKMDNIIELLLENDATKRVTIKTCMDISFR